MYVLFMAPLLGLLGDVCPLFQNQGGSPLSLLNLLHRINIHDSIPNIAFKQITWLWLWLRPRKPLLEHHKVLIAAEICHSIRQTQPFLI